MSFSFRPHSFQQNPLVPTRTHGDLRIWSISTGPLQQNCILIADDAGQGFLIDPGDDADKLRAHIEALKIDVQAILLTHGHFDHIGAVEALRGPLGATVHLHPNDLPLYRMGQQSAGRWDLPFVQPNDPDAEIKQDQLFEAGKVRLRARELFGHAPGHVVFLPEGLAPDVAGFVVAGDTVFAGSIGRTDLPLSNHPDLIAGIQREILPLPDDTYIYSGHGPVTNVGREKRSNPFLQD